MELFVRVFADAEADYPVYAKVNVTAELLASISKLSKLVSDNHIKHATTYGSPDEWENEDEYRIRGDEMHVSGENFWFTGYPKHADFNIGTNAISIKDAMQLLGHENSPNGTRVGNLLVHDGCAYLDLSPADVTEAESAD